MAFDYVVDNMFDLTVTGNKAMVYSAASCAIRYLPANWLESPPPGNEAHEFLVYNVHDKT